MTELAFLMEIFMGLVQVVAHPLFYVAILLVLLQYQRQNNLERRMFGVRVTRLGDQFARSLLFGAAGGLVATVLLTVVGVVLSPTEMTYVWVLALVLATFNVRYTCFAYAGGLLSLASLILNALPTYAFDQLLVQTVYEDVRGLHVADLLALVAVLHIVEAVLVRWTGAHGALPVFVEGKRGRLIGGFILQKFWVVPMATFVVTGTGAEATALDLPAWWPLMPLGAAAGALQVLPVPAILGYSGAALTQTPREKVKLTSRLLALYGLVLLGLAIGAAWWPPLMWVAALFAPLVHELLVLWELRGEQAGQPIYVRPLHGLKILDVLPKSPAMEIGLQSGETIVKVNGTPVNTPYDLHFALSQNPAYAKLEVLTMAGEPKFASTAIYMGDHHQLGVILVPDDATRQYVRLGSISPWRWLLGRLIGGRKGSPSTYH